MEKAKNVIKKYCGNEEYSVLEYLCEKSVQRLAVLRS